VREDAVIDLEGVEIVRMTPYTTYEVADGVCVTGLPANHDPRAYPQHILLEVEGQKLYYGIDGAWMLHDSFKFLKNKKLDIAVLDCTSGDYNGDFRMGEHNSIPMIRLMLPSLKTIGAIDEHTSIILTHLAPSLHKSHAETEIIANEFGATVAYDGRTVYTD
jgi:phosphoribosyl 1,2-cyclic phosphate phosphodiesterase